MPFPVAPVEESPAHSRPRRERGSRLQAVSQTSGNCLLVPLQADTRHVRNVRLAILDLIRPLQHRVRPILPFEPMRRFGNPHNVSGQLAIEMGRNRNARRRSDGSSSLPAGHAADPHEIRRDVIAGLPFYNARGP